jgi:uncharacterized membrane protein HdeD (DUF308 family)
MTCNVGGTERGIRIVLGIVLVGVGAFAGLPDAGMYAAYVVGAVALVTGAVGYCPAWQLFGVNTCPAKPTGTP